MNTKCPRFYLVSFAVTLLITVGLSANCWRLETAVDHQQNYMTVQFVYIGSSLAGFVLSMLTLGLLLAMPKFHFIAKIGVVLLFLVMLFAQFQIGRPETNVPVLIFALPGFLLISPLGGIVPKPLSNFGVQILQSFCLGRLKIEAS